MMMFIVVLSCILALVVLMAAYLLSAGQSRHKVIQKSRHTILEISAGRKNTHSLEGLINNPAEL